MQDNIRARSADHIGIETGVSAYGHLALLLATTANHPELEGDVGGNLNYSSRVQCVVAFYAPSDLNLLVSDPLDRTNADGAVAKLIGGAVASNLDKAAAASPSPMWTKLPAGLSDARRRGHAGAARTKPGLLRGAGQGRSAGPPGNCSPQRPWHHSSA